MGGFRCEYQVKTAADDCIGWPNDISEVEIRAEVDFWADRGVSSIKIKQATPEETRFIIDQAHRRDMTTTGHLSNYSGGYDVDPRVAISLGLDRLEHNITLGNGGPHSSEMDEVIDLLLKMSYSNPVSSLQALAAFRPKSLNSCSQFQPAWTVPGSPGSKPVTT
jgi:imidazolonepropionase-like amidohydrolase